MGANKVDKFAIPDVQNTVPIEEVIAGLRKSIVADCTGILRKAREGNIASSGSKSFKLRTIENKVSQITATCKLSFDVHELKELKQQCQLLSHELDARP